MVREGEYGADVVVIGSGPGGYVAAIRAAQLGGRVTIIEKDPKGWGGTCLNWGCIPTKALIGSVERYRAVKEAAELGVIVGEAKPDYEKMTARKDKIVTTLRGGVESLLKSNHVRKVVGSARLVSPHSVEVSLADGGKETIESQNIIIATGSRAIVPPIPGLAGDGIWTSDDAVSATSLPGSILIIGAGAVGLEFAYVFCGLCAKCTVVEIMPEILPAADAEIAAELKKSLTRQGITFHTNSKVEKVEKTGARKLISVVTTKGTEAVECDVVLVGAGRRPNVENLGLDEIGVKYSPKSRIEINDHLQTSVPGIYAIGDVTGKMLLAHLASHQGIVAAENCLGKATVMDYRAVPAPIYTEPEVATVGLTEQEARDAGYDVMIGRFPFRPLGKAMAIGTREGMVKIVAERKYGEVLGVHIIGVHATDLIHEAVVAIKLESTVEELITSIHAHPTLSEAVMEAAMDTRGESIHKLRN